MLLLCVLSGRALHGLNRKQMLSEKCFYPPLNLYNLTIDESRNLCENMTYMALNKYQAHIG